MEQVDYRSNPSFGDGSPPDPTPTPPPWDLSITAEHPNDFDYNQMSLGIAAEVKGWSPDSFQALTPDVHPGGRRPTL